MTHLTTCNTCSIFPQLKNLPVLPQTLLLSTSHLTSQHTMIHYTQFHVTREYSLNLLTSSVLISVAVETSDDTYDIQTVRQWIQTKDNVFNLDADFSDVFIDLHQSHVHWANTRLQLYTNHHWPLTFDTVYSMTYDLSHQQHNYNYYC